MCPGVQHRARHSTGLPVPVQFETPAKALCSWQTAGLKKKGSESLRLQGYYPQSWCPPATSRARERGLGPQAGVTRLTDGMAKAKVTCSIQCVLNLLGRGLWRLGCLLLQLLSGYGLRLHSVGTSSPLPTPCQRNVHRRWEEQGRGCFEILAPISFIWIPQCP